MTFKKALLAGAAVAAIFTLPGQASITDTAHFEVTGTVVVWAGDGTGGSVVSDFIVKDPADGTTDLDLISGDATAVVTGSLVAMDALSNPQRLDYGGSDGNSFNNIDPNSYATPTAGIFASAAVLGDYVRAENDSLSSSFYVASNTGFKINAYISNSTVSGDFALDDVAYTMVMDMDESGGTIDHGASSQNPMCTLDTSFVDLGDFSTSSVSQSEIMDCTQATAGSDGTIQEQSVRFDSSYEFVYDLSKGVGEVQADITYTVFMP